MIELLRQRVRQAWQTPLQCLRFIHGLRKHSFVFRRKSLSFDAPNTILNRQVDKFSTLFEQGGRIVFHADTEETPFRYSPPCDTIAVNPPVRQPTYSLHCHLRKGNGRCLPVTGLTREGLSSLIALAEAQVQWRERDYSECRTLIISIDPLPRHSHLPYVSRGQTCRSYKANSLL